MICHGGLGVWFVPNPTETEFLQAFLNIRPSFLTRQDIISIARGGQGGMQDDVLGLDHSQAPAQQSSICSDPSYSELIDLVCDVVAHWLVSSCIAML